MKQQHKCVGWAVATAFTATCLQALAQAGAGNPLDTLPKAQPSERGGVTSQVVPPAPTPQALLATQVTPLRFDVEGVRSIPFDEVASRFAPWVRQPTTIGSLVALTEEVTRLYQERGYALSFCYVPQQDFRDGVVRIVVVEGHVADIRIEGDAGRAAAKVRELAEPIRKEKPLRRETFERHVQLLGWIPGLRIEAQAPLPTSTDGATVLTLKVSQQPYALSTGVDIRQSKPRLLVTGALNNPVAAGSQLSVSALASSLHPDQYYAMQYLQLVGQDGLSLKLDASHYRGNPDLQLGTSTGLDRVTTNDKVELSASYPLKLSKSMSLVASGGGYGVNYADDYTNPATAGAVRYETRVRALFGQLSYSLSLPERTRRASVLLARGFNGAGARATATTNVPGFLATNAVDLSFTKLQVQASQTDIWPARLGTVVSMLVQYSPDSLPATERVSFGGMRFARGYAPGEAAGDSGWGLAAEINRSYPLEGHYLKLIQPYLLLETARVSNKVGDAIPARLSSVALGARLSDRRYYSVDLSVARPTGDLPLENPRRSIRWTAGLNYHLGEP